MSRARVVPRAGRVAISFLNPSDVSPTRAVPHLFGRRGGPEPGRIGIPCEIAWNESSHSILYEFMHAEYGIFVYTIWPLFSAAPHARHARTAARARRETLEERLSRSGYVLVSTINRLVTVYRIHSARAS